MPSPLAMPRGRRCRLDADLVRIDAPDRADRGRPASDGRAGRGLTSASRLAVVPDLDLLFHAHRTVTHSVSPRSLVVAIVAAAVTGQVTGRTVVARRR